IGCGAPSESAITPPPSREIHPLPQAAERLRARLAALEGTDAPVSLLITEEELNAYVSESQGPLAPMHFWFTRNKIFLSTEVRFWGQHHLEAWATLDAAEGALRIRFTEAAWDGHALPQFALRTLSRAAEVALEDAHFPFTIERVTLSEGMVLLTVRGTLSK
ncbi:MAG: hypothetical protein H5T70_08455, partial [Chloroflexi bacterium]|nr:hypothetical protein [Chloroflexota bacterium]